MRGFRVWVGSMRWRRTSCRGFRSLRRWRGIMWWRRWGIPGLRGGLRIRCHCRYMSRFCRFSMCRGWCWWWGWRLLWAVGRGGKGEQGEVVEGYQRRRRHPRPSIATINSIWKESGSITKSRGNKNRKGIMIGSNIRKKWTQRSISRICLGSMRGNRRRGREPANSKRSITTNTQKSRNSTACSPTSSKKRPKTHKPRARSRQWATSPPSNNPKTQPIRTTTNKKSSNRSKSSVAVTQISERLQRQAGDEPQKPQNLQSE